MFRKKNDSPQERKFQILEIEIEKEQEGVEPKKFMFWMFMGTITLLFTGVMAAFLINRGMESWVNLILPWEFYLSTLTILCSSYFMHRSYLLAKSNDFDISEPSEDF